MTTYRSGISYDFISICYNECQEGMITDDGILLKNELQSFLSSPINAPLFQQVLATVLRIGSFDELL